MALSESVRRTLRVLITPPQRLQSHILACDAAGQPLASLALELSISRGGGLSVIESGEDGELLNACEVGWPDGLAELGPVALAHAMAVLWAKAAEERLPRGLAAIHSSSQLTSPDGNMVLPAWHYQMTDNAGELRLIASGQTQRTVRLAHGELKSLRQLLVLLQHQAVAPD
ncbi:hypothetical protein [Chitinimonas sp.]|uniref:hypothetical protein n=1 Tax=Chitinimonas sp. TaxID=1934313 RepID=UPI0035B23747